MLYTILVIIYIIAAIALIIFLLISGARPTRTLAWLIIIVVLPVGGMLLFFMFGINRRKYKFYKLKRTRAVNQYLERANRYYHQLDKESTDIQEISGHIKLAKVIIKNSGTLPLDGNKVNVLQDGPETFQSILDAMEQAKHFIHIQYYIFEEGEVAERILEVLERKTGQGIEARFIYDGLGSFSLSDNFLNRLKKAGVQTYSFMPLNFGRITRSLNYRNHRKIVIVDGHTGFTGGINISDKYIKGNTELGKWRDTHLRIEGPAVRSLHRVFSNDWYFVSTKEELQNKRYFPIVNQRGDSTVQVVHSGPDSDFPGVRQQYFTTINQAENYVYIANSYIIPGEALMESLTTAALSGVDVRILLPEKSDSRLVKWTVRSYFEELLRAGVKIYLYQERFLHCKIIIADDSVASVGTANIDIRSFEQNFEVNAVIYDKDVAMKLKTDFLEDCQKSTPLEFSRFRKRSHFEKLAEGAARIFSPLL